MNLVQTIIPYHANILQMLMWNQWKTLKIPGNFLLLNGCGWTYMILNICYPSCKLIPTHGKPPRQTQHVATLHDLRPPFLEGLGFQIYTMKELEILFLLDHACLQFSCPLIRHLAGQTEITCFHIQDSLSFEELAWVNCISHRDSLLSHSFQGPDSVTTVTEVQYHGGWRWSWFERRPKATLKHCKSAGEKAEGPAPAVSVVNYDWLTSKILSTIAKTGMLDRRTMNKNG